MTIRNILLLSALALSLSAPAAWAGMPDDIRDGALIEMEGNVLDKATVMATELEVTTGMAGEDGIKGIIEVVNPSERTVVIAGVTVIAEADALIQDEENMPMEFSGFVIGRRGKAEGKYENGIIMASRVKMKRFKEGRENEIELIGQATKVNRKGESFTLLGKEVLVTPTTVVEVE